VFIFAIVIIVCRAAVRLDYLIGGSNCSKGAPPAASDTDATPVPLELLFVVLLFSTTSITRYSLVTGHCSITCFPSKKYSFLSSFSVFILTSFLLSSSNLYATGSNCFESKAG
jgi:hypothetical protein